MDDNLTFDMLWNNLKTKNEAARETLECSEQIASIVQSIVKARIDKGWSQRDLAKSCKLSQPAIARFEKLQVVPRLDTVIKIANKVDIKLCAQAVKKKECAKDTKLIQISKYTNNKQNFRYDWNNTSLQTAVQ